MGGSGLVGALSGVRPRVSGCLLLRGSCTVVAVSGPRRRCGGADWVAVRGVMALDAVSVCVSSHRSTRGLLVWSATVMVCSWC
jgi:hypothetical protein